MNLAPLDERRGHHLDPTQLAILARCIAEPTTSAGMTVGDRAALRRLLELGLVQCVHEEPYQGLRTPRAYSTTAAGVAELGRESEHAKAWIVRVCLERERAEARARGAA